MKIFRRFIRKGDAILDAHKYGLKAWPIEVKEKTEKKEIRSASSERANKKTNAIKRK